MSFFYETPLTPANRSWAQGHSRPGDLWAAARDVAIFAGNVNSAEKAMEEAYDRRIAAIRTATGQELANPLRVPVLPPRAAGTSPPGAARNRAEAQARFARDLERLQAQYPDKVRDIRATVPVAEDARQIARAAEDSFNMAWSAADGFWTKWAATLGGGFAGSLRDPAQVASLFLGGGPGAGRTTAWRIMQSALREAAVNGAVEAALQPEVQAWRREAGLSAGFDEALRQTLATAGFAGVLGGAGQSLAEVAGRLVGGLPAEAPIRRALEGGPDEAAAVLAPVADALAPAARGALKAQEADTALAMARPPGVDPRAHDEAMAAAIAAAENEGPIVHIDMTARRRPGGVDRPMNVMEFIAARGGLRDDGGELSSRDLNFRNTMTRWGPAYRKAGERQAIGGLFGGGGGRSGKGLSPDQMREALVEAGYLHDDGDLTGRPSTTTSDDVYRLIDRHLAGDTVISRRDMEWQAEIDAARTAKAGRDELADRYQPHEADFIRRYNWGLFDAYQQAGIDIRGVPEEDAALAHRLMFEDGLDADSAIERAALMLVDRDTARVAPEAQVEDIPGFGEVTSHARLPGRGGEVPRTGETDAGRGSGGGVRDQRRTPRPAGEDPRSPPEAAAGGLANDAPPAPEGGIDDVTAPEVSSETGAMLAAIEADWQRLAAEPGGLPPGMDNLDDLLTEADRPADLARLVDACKAV